MIDYNEERSHDSLGGMTPSSTATNTPKALLLRCLLDGGAYEVNEAASASPKPSEFGKAGDAWGNEGWLASAYFTPVPKPLRPTAHEATIAPLLPDRCAPIRRNGPGNQSCYLGRISTQAREPASYSFHRPVSNALIQPDFLTASPQMRFSLGYRPN
jgi:hypothetical protein